ncbi:transporter [Photobacterium swingsii]|uniref:Sodium-dependent transporter n=1 Tax=Photobacterium swingsii TaxID=680026 RepID=A0A0J8XV42_9GAMM|nr:sodium-dependent transporter [Photobacterium swingsii]KMV29219.1 transporter [Photobacterium swingsii]PSW23160.1 sodium-dependent transporter [Photobacterium swingsii]
MASQSRAQFSSRIGFILAAAGSAVGLGNIWGFPTQAASNGGAVFLIVYLLMVFALAYPLLVAELTIGRYGSANPIKSLRSIWPQQKKAATGLGVAGMIAVSMILSFYAIVAGWLLGSLIGPILNSLGMIAAAQWLESFSTARNLILMIIFMVLTIMVVRNGVAEGIERWSTRLMPVLLVLFLFMVAYILTQDGAINGLKMYLIPDFSHFSADLVVSAMGQAFFSLSLGVCSMMVYGSYIKKDVNLPKVAAQVALLDTSVAFIAGLLILPAMFVAANNGVEIYNEAGALLSSDTLVFSVLPAMFETMGAAGLLVGILFFILMVIAALTSSISMLEVPVACATEELQQDRKVAVWWIGGIITIFSGIIVFNFGDMFGLVISLTTEYAQPILGMVFALLVGWVWKRDQALQEIKQGYPELEQGLFWKIWPWYVRVVCPLLMLFVFFA